MVDDSVLQDDGGDWTTDGDSEDYDREWSDSEPSEAKENLNILDTMLKDRAPLRNDISTLIDAHRNEKPPPFSTAELMIMAIVNSDKASIGSAEIAAWILRTFPFYSKKAVDYGCGGSKCLLSRDTYLFIWEDFYKALDSHDVPFIDCCGYEKGVIAKHARVFLRRWLEPERKGVLRFLDLPPELRTRIYHMALVYPSPAIMTTDDPEHSFVMLHATGRDISERGDCKLGNDVSATRAIGTLDAVMDKICLCKQMKAEACPIFYGANAFHPTSLRVLSRFVKFAEKKGLRHLKKVHIDVHICLDICIAQDDCMKVAIETLQDGTSLDELMVVVKDRCNETRCQPRRTHDPLATTNGPSFAALTRLMSRTKRVNISLGLWHGDDRLLCRRMKDLALKEAARLKIEDTKKAADSENL